MVNKSFCKLIHRIANDVNPKDALEDIDKVLVKHEHDGSVIPTELLPACGIKILVVS